MATASHVVVEAVPSPWAPLKSRVFAVLWGATLIGSIGVWMREVASGWLMTELAPSPLMVSLVQAAGTLPFFLFSLPAGALSDLLDRRKILLVTQSSLMALSLTMAALTALGAMTPALLLVGTLLAGIGAAHSGPVWQSVVPELVDKSEFRSAVALNSLSVNIARAIGPALGGAIIVSSGVAAAYLADAATYIIVLAALLWWKRPRKASLLPPEHLLPAVAAAIRYARVSAPLKRTLLRALLFFVFGSAPWAVLPLLVSQNLAGSAGFYGLMLGAIGAGAVCGALIMPRLRQRLPSDRLVRLATVMLSLVSLGLASTDQKMVALTLMPFLGLAWITVLSSLSVTAQSVLPDWVRGRGMAMYSMVFFGSMAVGSLVWGQVSQFTSTQTGLAVAALLGLGGALITKRIPLPAGVDDLSPSRHWPEPGARGTVAGDSGPVMIMIEYRIPSSAVAAFEPAIRALGSTRKRDGAYAWGVYQDTEDHERFVEYFIVESWVQHMRQHERVSRTDELLQAAVRSLHTGLVPPKVSHLLNIGQMQSTTGPLPSEVRGHDI